MPNNNNNNDVDLESDGSYFNIPVNVLQNLFNPPSLKTLIQLGGIHAIAQDLHTSLSDGLSLNFNNSNQRLKIYGKNKLPPKNQKSFLQLCWEALNDQVLIILSISAVVSLILGLYQTFYQPPEYDDDGKPLPKIQWVDGCAILLAVIIVVIVGAVNDYNKEKQFLKLNNKKQDRKIIVYRSGEKKIISIYDLLAGDLLYVETGDVMPADAILISGECSCDESTITGESKTIKKSTVFQALDYYNEEIKSIYHNNNNNNNNNNNPKNSINKDMKSNQTLSLSLDVDFSSSNSSLQFDIGDDEDALDPFLISGSKLLSGQGKALVISVGPNSVNGRIMTSLSNDDDEEETPLQERLNILANGISKYGFLAAILLFIILLFKFIYQLSNILSHLTAAEKLSKLINIIITSITIVVVAIPEGLPLAVTLALAFATIRMTEDGNLVRVLKSCETMGGATTVCSDKTGTLTINRMTVVQGLIGDLGIFNDSSFSGSTIDILKKCSDNVINSLLNNIYLNSTAFDNDIKNNNNELDNDDTGANNSLYQNANPKSFWNWLSSKKNQHYHQLLNTPTESEQTTQPTEQPTDDFIGSKTECALLSLVKNRLSKIRSLPVLKEFREANEKNLVKIIPFESALKWSGVVFHDISSDSYTFYIKGAAEIVMEHCNSILELNGDAVKITEEKFEKVDKIRESMANSALRAVALGHYTFKTNELSKIDWETITTDDLLSYNLVLDALVGIQDPLRPGVKKAIDECHRAGVKVRMVTGDNILTAKAISKGCGILDDETFNDPSCYLEGKEFRALSDKEKLKIVPKLCILARSSPDDKRILVKTLKELGEVVAVTGDGTNDAPALKLADVGFSMGLSGTEVAREASDIVLMTDDFSSIVNAIKWGRTVAASIRKFVQFQLTVNFTAVILTFFTAICSVEDSSVLTAVQLLWVNLIMDTLAALALATDKPDDDVLDYEPEGRNSEMISTNMWKMILGISVPQLFITLMLYFYGDVIFFGKNDSELKISERMMLKALTFNTFVWMQVFTLFVSRILNEPKFLNGNSSWKDRISSENIGFFNHITRNSWFIAIVALISTLQVLIMLYGGPAFSVAPQTPQMWIAALLCGYAMIPIGTILRIIPDSFFLRILPISGIKKFIEVFEYFMFGCGLFQSETPDNFNNSISIDVDNNSNNNIAGQYTNRINTNPPDIITSDTPSPIIDASMHNATENHKLARLNTLLTNSSNTSLSSAQGSKRNPPSFYRQRSPSQEHLLEDTDDNRSYSGIDSN